MLQVDRCSHEMRKMYYSKVICFVLLAMVLVSVVLEQADGFSIGLGGQFYRKKEVSWYLALLDIFYNSYRFPVISILQT